MIERDQASSPLSHRQPPFLPPLWLITTIKTTHRSSSIWAHPHLLIPSPQPETAEAPEKQISHHVSESRRLPSLF